MLDLHAHFGRERKAILNDTCTGLDGELWYLTELARWLRAHGRNRFLWTAPPLRRPGAVGSPAAAVATV